MEYVIMAEYKINQYDCIILKDGREGCVVEVWDEKHFSVDVGSSPKDWKNIEVTIDDIDFEQMNRLNLFTEKGANKAEYFSKG